MATGHKKYSASAAHRNFKCPGSVREIAKLPSRPTSPYAEEGTKAHHILEVALKNGHRQARIAWVQDSDYWCSDVDTGMCNAVQECLDYVYFLLDSDPNARLFIETAFDLPTDNAPGEAGGTLDIGIYLPSMETLYIVDYKHGVGIAVDAVDNEQLLHYGTGAIFSEELSILDYTKIVLVIVQPRAFHALGPLREWEVTVDQALDFLQYADQKYGECEAPDAPLVPGEDQCRFCDAKPTCRAIEARALKVAGNDFASVRDLTAIRLGLPQEMTLERVAYILDAGDMLRDWLNDVHQYAYEQAMLGREIPGRKLVAASARREWYGEHAEIAEQLMLLAGVELDDVMPRKLMTITDAEKLVVAMYKAASPSAKRGSANQAATEAKEAMAYLTDKKSTGIVSLVPITDKRPPASIAGASFSGVDTSLIPAPGTGPSSQT